LEKNIFSERFLIFVMQENHQEQKKETFIGIDMGSALIKIAEAVKTESGVSFNSVAVESIVGREHVSEAYISEVIKKLISASGISATKAVFALSGNQVAIRHIDFPKMSPKLLEKNIKNELKKELGHPVENYIFHHMIMKEFEAKNEDGTTQKKERVIIAAVETALVDKINDIAKLSGLSVAGIVSANLALYSMSKKMHMLDKLGPEEVLMYLDFGNSQITTNFVSREGLRFSKDINMGGSSLTNVIKTLSPGGSPVTMAEAEEMKFKIGILSQDVIDNMDDSNADSNFHKVLNVSFKKLLQRIRLSTGYFFAHFKESVSFQALRKIYLTGGNSEMPGMKEFFTEYYETSVFKINCWDFVNTEMCDAATCAKYNASYANISAAMYEFFHPEYSMNFNAVKKLAASVKGRERFSVDEFIDKSIPALKLLTKYGTLNIAAGALALYIISFSAIFVWNFFALSSLTAEKKETDSKYEELNSADAKNKRRQISEHYEVFQKKMNAKNVIEFKKYSIDQILLAVSESIPPDVSIKSVKLFNEDKPVLSLSGITAAYDSALKFNESLKKHHSTAGVVVKKTDQVENRVEFQFELALDREMKK